MRNYRFFLIILLFLAAGKIYSQEVQYPDSLMTITQPGENIIKNIGLFGSWNSITHISKFLQLPGIDNCCPEFGNGSGSGFSFGIMTDFGLFDKARIAVRPYFETGNGTHTDLEGGIKIGINGIDYDGVIEHSVNTEYSSAGLQAAFEYNVWESLYLRGGFEASYYFTSTFDQKETLIKPSQFGTFEGGSRIRNRKSGDLPDGSSYSIGLLFGAAWELPLNTKNSLLLVPEINYSFGLTPYITDYNWSLNKLKLGANIKYILPDGIPDTVFNSEISLEGLIVDNDGVEAPMANIEISDYLECGKLKSSKLFPPAIRLLPHIITKMPVSKYSLKVMQGEKTIRNFDGEGPVPEFIDWDILGDSAQIIDNNNNVSFYLGILTTDNQALNSNIVSTGFANKSYDISSGVTYEGFDDSLKIPVKFDTLNIEETVSTNMRPLLTYVFFDKNSSKIPERYEKLTVNEAPHFYIEQLKDLGTLDTYYKILNIIGRRLVEYDTSTVLLTGCNSDAGVETNSFALSRARAESVRKYLIDVWGIAPERIRVKARNLPAMPSKTSEKDFYDAVRDENRRVEISAYDWKIIEPVVTFDTLRSIEPQNIRFKAETKGDIPVSSSKFKATIGSGELLNLSNNESGSIEGEMNITRNRDYFQQAANMINYTYEGKNSEGFACTSYGYVPYKIKIKDSTFDRYSLILFDFDSYNLSDANTRISEYIKSRIARSESGEVLGSAEIIGFTDQIGSESYNLELSAKRAESIYTDLGITSDKITYKGIGEEKLLYPDINPEGRFYSRTVTITVINPRDTNNGR